MRLIVEDPIVTVKCRTAIKMSLFIEDICICCCLKWSFLSNEMKC